MSDTTTVAAEPNEQPAEERPVSRLQRALVSASIVGVVVLGSAGIATSDLAQPPEQGGKARQFVPADGTAMLITAADGSRSVHETARGSGPGLLLELPPLAASPIFETSTHEQLRGAQLWRESVTPLDADTPQTTTLYLLDERGVSMLASLGGEAGFSYSPALVMLPADAAPGVTWEGEGAAMPAGLLNYRMSGAIAGDADGCLRVTTDTRYVDPDAGVELLAVAETATWCPGRGIVRDEGIVAGEHVSFSSAPFPELGGLGDPLVTDGAATDWSAASAWRARVLEVQLSDPVYGESMQAVPFAGLATSSRDGGFVAAVGSRLAHYSVGGDTATRDWVASPGGDLLGIATIGDVTLASTSQRRLIAYDARGARLWAMRFPDVVVAPPAGVRDGDAVVVSLDGTLRRIDIATGAVVWEVELRTDVAAPLATDTGLVVVVDRGGNVLARSLVDGAERWERHLPGAARIAAGDGTVAVQSANADIWALTAGDGGVRWRSGHAGVSRELLLVDGWIVSQSDDGTAAWRAAGAGERAWSSSAEHGLLSDGARLVLAGATSVELREVDGTLREQVAIDAAGPGVTRMYLPTAGGIRILHTDATGIEVR